MTKFLGAIFACLMLAACQTTGTKPRDSAAGEFDSPVRPGEIRVGLTKPDPAKWTAQRSDMGNVVRYIYNCRPSACSTGARVVSTIGPGPIPIQDREALRQYFQFSSSPAQAAGWTPVSPARIGTFRGYTTVQDVRRQEIEGKVHYLHHLHLYTGEHIVGIAAGSVDNDLARRHLNQFLNAVVIQNGGRRVASQ